MSIRTNRHLERGFTLIEMIVTITLLGFVAAMVANYMMNAVANSAVPVVRVMDRGAAQGIMEAISSDYRALLVKDPDTALSKLKQHIEKGEKDESEAYYGSVEYESETAFIDFNAAGQETTSTTSDILKVTISVNEQTVVALFSR